MKLIRLLAAAFLAFAPAIAFAQAPPAVQTQKTQAQGGWDATAPMTVHVQAPPTAPVSGGGVINIGQAFGTLLQPYIDALVQALIVGGIGWLGYIAKNRLGVNIDQGQRDALNAFLTNAASALIAAGAVQIKDKTIHVRSEALASQANSAIMRIPDALAHFGIDATSAQKMLEDKIIAAIPQVPAGAAMIAGAHAADPGAPIAAAPMVSGDRPPAQPAPSPPPPPVATVPVPPQAPAEPPAGQA